MKSNSCWINTCTKVKHDEILEYYYLAMRDLQDGAPIQELESALKMYEELEEFEKCAGILKAINEAKYMTIKNIKNGHKNN